MKKRFILSTVLPAMLVAGALSAAGGSNMRRPMTEAELASYGGRVQSAVLMVGPSAFKTAIDSGHFDERGVPFVRCHHRFDGVRVWGSDFVMNNEGRGMTQVSGANAEPQWLIDTKPVLTANQALAIVKALPDADDFLALPPTNELVIYPTLIQKPKAEHRSVATEDLRAEQMEDVIENVRLAYHVVAYTREAIVDALTGAILDEWSAIQTADEAKFNTQWSGPRVGETTQNSSGEYTLEDSVRKFKVYDLALKGSGGKLFKDYNNDNIWGDGKQLEGKNTPKNSDNYQAAGADLYCGMQTTYDMYKNVFNFNGYNGKGAMPSVNAHLGDKSGNPYDNAFSSGSSVSFGDGYKKLFALTSIDIVSHEFGHSVCNSTARYAYKGESGGMNESNSDIMGEMSEFYQKGAEGKGNVIPDNGGDWLIGGKVVKPKNGGSEGTPMRWFVKPSRLFAVSGG